VGRAFWAVHAQDCRPSVKYKRVAVREDEVPVISVFRNIEILRSFRIRVRCNMSDPSGTASVSGQSTATVSVGYCCCHGG